MALALFQFREVAVAFFAGYNLQWLWPLLTSCGLSIILTASLIKIAPQRGWLAFPGQNRWNQRVVAQFGGIPILLSAVGVVFALPVARSVLYVVFLTLGMAVLGAVDDMVGLGPKPKLVIQVLLASFAVQAGVVHPLTHTAWLNALFTVFWIVAITNAFNLIDNIDGLAAGTAAIALLQIVLLAGISAPVAMVALCLLASVVGFLFFNLHPAKVFMGDVGSLPIGFFLACASVMTASHLSSLGSVLLVPCLVLFIPIFDMLLVSVTRRLNGRAISRGARDHASHRLVLLGLTERRAVAILYAVAFIAGLLAFCRERFWPEWGAGFLSLFLLVATLFWLYLAKLKLPESWLSQSTVLIISFPAFFLRAAAKVSVLALDSAVIALGLYFACLSTLGNMGGPFLAQFWATVTASIFIKLACLIATGAYKEKWTLSAIKETYPVIKGVFLAALVVAVGWLVLSASVNLPVFVILIDAALTSALLLLARASMRLFDYILRGLRTVPVPQQQSAIQDVQHIVASGTDAAASERRNNDANKWEM